MGFDRLILSDPQTSDFDTARKVAVSAAAILDNASIFPSLAEAAAGSGIRFLVGTTGRERKSRHTMDISAGAPGIIERSPHGGVALLFGPEDRGLNNEELTLCRMVVTIPTAGELGSYNLSHAAAIVLYTLMITAGPFPSPAQRRTADLSRMEGMYEHVQELLTETGFLLSENPRHKMQAVREFINRAEPTEDEVKMIRGVCRRLLWHLRNRKE
jgi:tRNA/rRNA methyltransferase